MTSEQVVDLVQAIAWPLVVVAGLVVLRPVLPGLAGEMGRRATKISVFQIAVELAPAGTSGDTRPAAVAVMGAPVVGPSLLPALVAELQKRESADYMVIDLLEDQGWLTSRLFLWADLLPRTRSLRCFVFVTPVDGKRFVALASARDVRWALAMRYPWLEEIYSAAYADAVATSGNVMGRDRIGLDWQAAQKIAMNFVDRVQIHEQPTEHGEQWVQLGEKWEHGEWISPGAAEALLGEVLSREAAEKTLATDDDALAIQVSRASGRYVALVDADRRLVGVVDRGTAPRANA
jgi:hypothetical protein